MVKNPPVKANDLRDSGSTLGGSVGKECASNARDLSSIPGWGRSPEGGNGNPLHYSCLENPHGQRSLAGYNLWGRKESDTAACLSTALCAQPSAGHQRGLPVVKRGCSVTAVYCLGSSGCTGGRGGPSFPTVPPLSTLSEGL